MKLVHALQEELAKVERELVSMEKNLETIVVAQVRKSCSVSNKLRGKLACFHLQVRDMEHLQVMDQAGSVFGQVCLLFI
jgi:hypothetical protein